MESVTTSDATSGRSINPGMTIPWVTTVARIVVAGVLFVAGWLKAGTPALSVEAVKNYELLPDQVATVVGHALPIFEIVVGVMLLTGLLTRVVAVIAGLLMVAFVIGIASAWARGLRIDCGCFGSGGQLAAGQDPGYLWEILRDIGLLLLSVWTVRFAPGRLALDSVLGLAPRRDRLDDRHDQDDDEEIEDQEAAGVLDRKENH